MSARLDRIEFKFLIGQAQRDALLARISDRVKPDANSGGGFTYPILSLYYDSAERDCYWDKIRGERNRSKLRLRVYGSRDGAVPPATFLEIKQKCNGRGVKRRVKVDLDEASAFLAGTVAALRGRSRGEELTLTEARHQARSRKLEPVLVMRYDRAAYMGREPGSDLRITLDQGVRYRFDQFIVEPDDSRFSDESSVLGVGVSVLEVKVIDAIPYWLSKLLSELRCVPQSHSKYCRALELGDPVLRKALAPGWLTRMTSGALAAM
jgi:SPX domain protein involved in polyphosphate accumulation